MRRGAVFNGQPLPALAPPSWVSPLAPRRAREAAAGANPRRAVRVPVSGSRPALREALRGSHTGSCWSAPAAELQERVPCLPAATCVCFTAEQTGAASGPHLETPGKTGSAGECVRACACAGVCALGEAVEAAVPWLGAGPGGIARFSPAGAGDLQAIPLYFCPELTSPAPQPGATSLTVAPAPHLQTLSLLCLPSPHQLPVIN